jgi:nitroreductase
LRHESNVDAIETIRTRRSIGKLTGDVSPEVVRELVELALCAPNHKLTNPWRFIALRGSARQKLAEVWSSVAQTLPTPPGVERESFVAKEARKALRAPVLLVVASRVDADPVRAEEDVAAAAAAAQNVLLAAHAKGLGAIWRTGAIARHPKVKAHLGLDESDRIVAIIYLGQPAMAAPVTQPRDLDSYLTVRD